MTNQEILNKIGNVKKGIYISLKKKKDLGEGIEKISHLVIRLGIDFANMKINEGREIGSLPWGHWVEGLEGLVIEHTNKQGEKQYYLRVASSYANNGKCYYTKDGQEISKEEVITLIGEKKLENKALDVYNIKFENILELGI